MAKKETGRCQVLDSWRTGGKRAPGIVGRCRVRACAKTTTNLCSQGHTVERLKVEMVFLSPPQRNLKRSLMAVRCFSYFGPSNGKTLTLNKCLEEKDLQWSNTAIC